MIANMSLEFQTSTWECGNMNAYIINMYLKQLFDITIKIERFETSKKLILVGFLINTHVLSMMKFFRNQVSLMIVIFKFKHEILLWASRITRVFIIMARKVTL